MAVIIDNGQCMGCGACVAVCPQQALKLDLQSGVPWIRVDRSLCTDCGACVPRCPVQIIRLPGQAPPAPEPSARPKIIPFPGGIEETGSSPPVLTIDPSDEGSSAWRPGSGRLRRRVKDRLRRLLRD